ncbi:DNA topoisomerase 6 subunit A [Tanacetum coccineum]
MKKRDLNVAKALLKLVKQNHDYVHELGIMIKTKEKAEIEALSAIEVGYLATRYLPSKLRNLDWRNQRTLQPKHELVEQALLRRISEGRLAGRMAF